jgi:flagella basal body P-ring formation protein FlgA
MGVLPGTVLRPAMLKAPKVETVVRKGQTIVMRLDRAGFSIVALAEAQQDGKPGDIVRVMNVDTKRLVNAKVGADGSVEPILDEVSQ